MQRGVRSPAFVYDEELKSMNKAKERVIDHLSHELKTPLSLISATVDRISKKLDQAQILRFLL